MWVDSHLGCWAHNDFQWLRRKWLPSTFGIISFLIAEDFMTDDGELFHCSSLVIWLSQCPCLQADLVLAWWTLMGSFYFFLIQLSPITAQHELVVLILHVSVLYLIYTLWIVDRSSHHLCGLPSSTICLLLVVWCFLRHQLACHGILNCGTLNLHSLIG